jgi:hypothetical protein
MLSRLDGWGGGEQSPALRSLPPPPEEGIRSWEGPGETYSLKEQRRGLSWDTCS